jgi:hypothetical protein
VIALVEHPAPRRGGTGSRRAAGESGDARRPARA